MRSIILGKHECQRLGIFCIILVYGVIFVGCALCHAMTSDAIEVNAIRCHNLLIIIALSNDIYIFGVLWSESLLTLLDIETYFSIFIITQLLSFVAIYLQIDAHKVSIEC